MYNRILSLSESETNSLFLFGARQTGKGRLSDLDSAIFHHGHEWSQQAGTDSCRMGDYER